MVLCLDDLAAEFLLLVIAYIERVSIFFFFNNVCRRILRISLDYVRIPLEYIVNSISHVKETILGFLICIIRVISLVDSGFGLLLAIC